MGDFNVDALRGNDYVLNSIISANSDEFTFDQLEKMGFSQDDIKNLSEKYDGKDKLTLADLKAAGYNKQVAQIAVDTVPQRNIISIWNQSLSDGKVDELPNMLANNKQEKA